MRYLKMTNWERWQSYKNGKTSSTQSWIKVHRNLLLNPEWLSLTEEQKGQLVSLWLVAAEKCGRLPDDLQLIARVCQINAENLHMEVFIAHGFIEKPRRDSIPKQPSEENRIEENRIEEKRREGKGGGSKGEGEPARKPGHAVELKEVFDQWNSHEDLTTHRAMNPKMRKVVKDRLLEGRSVDDLKAAIDRYAVLVQLGTGPGYNGWTLDELLGRDGGTWIDKCLDPNYHGIVQPGGRAQERQDRNVKAGQSWLNKFGGEDES